MKKMKTLAALLATIAALVVGTGVASAAASDTETAQTARTMGHDWL